MSIEKLPELKAMPSLKTLCIYFDKSGADHHALWEEAERVMQPEIQVEGWEFGGVSGLSHRASMLAATKIAFREFCNDSVEFIRNFTMPP